ncbi:MAG: hypothetical protein V4714_19925 [Bacteroidota bacterium]
MKNTPNDRMKEKDVIDETRYMFSWLQTIIYKLFGFYQRLRGNLLIYLIVA